MSLVEVIPLTAPLAVIAHQIFRKHETYRIYVHVCLLVGPPVLATAHVSSSYSFSTLGTVFLKTLISYVAALVTSVIVYRISPFHPLAKYPGPFWRRISMLGPAAVAASGDRYRAFADMHEKYGDIVRTGPNELSIADASFVGPILGTSGLPKGPNHVGDAMSDTKISMAGIQDIPLHLQRRRPWNRGLSPNALEEYEPLIAEKAHLLVQRLADQSGSVDLGVWFKYFAYDFMTDMAFGGGSEMLRDGDKDNIWSVLEDGMAVGTVLQSLPWLGIYISLFPSLAGPFFALQEDGRRRARERLERGSKTKDLYHYLCNEDLPNKPPPTLQDLAEDGILAVVAGSDTASMTLTSMFYGLLTHPECYATLQREVDQYYPAGEPATVTKHHREMHYLQAVIDEALRLFPPVPLGTQRQVPHSAAPMVVNSVVLPPGTSVYLPTWVLHRDPRNFVFPDEFWPERWLIASGELRFEDARLPSSATTQIGRQEVEFVHNEIAFTPFAAGPMNCPGKGLAMLELRMVTVALMKNFRFKLSEGWDPETFEQEYRDYYTAARPRMPVVYESRSDA